jgi:uncharacterized protein with HEPN domain
MASEDLLISKIIKHIDKINGYIAGLSRNDFLTDTKLVEACVFNLLQIGELAWRLTDEFRTAHPEIPWVKIRGLRHRIVHDYEGVKLEIIWDITSLDLPPLRAQLAGLAAAGRPG